MEWIHANKWNIIIILVLVCIVGAIVLRLVRAKKQGQSSCSCCENCPMECSKRKT